MLRTDLWVAAFVRRHNDIGHICVISRRGDPIAGQIFIELDQLNGAVTLFAPAPATSREEDDADRFFVKRFDKTDPETVRKRLAQEEKFDPDFWVISLEMREDDPGIRMARS